MSFPTEVLADSPTLYWRLEETSGTIANDETANNLDGDYTNTPTLNQTGLLSGSKAVSFNGVNEYVQIGGGVARSDTCTFEILFKRNSTASTQQGLFQLSNSIGAYIDTDGTIRVANAAGTTATANSGATKVANTSWHHLVVTKNGSTNKIYLDNVDVTTSVGNITVASGTSVADLAHHISYYGNITVDEYAYYNGTALSSTRIAAHYNAGFASSTFPVVAATNSGNQATDASSHTINLPAGINAGDLLMLFMTADESNTLPVPTGWTSLNASASATHTVRVSYKIAIGSEGATTTTTTDAPQQSAHVTYRIIGWHGTTPPAISTVVTGTSVSPDPTALNPTAWDVEDTLWIDVAAWDVGTASVAAYPSGYSSNQVTDRSNTSTGVGVAASTKNLTTASEDPPAYSLSSTQAWKAYTIAVRPGTSGGSPSPPPTAGFSHSETGLTSTFTNTTTGGATSYSWNFGDSTTSTLTNPSHTYATSGTYTVVLTATNSNGSDTETQSVTVNAPPTANFSISGTGLTRTFTDTSTDPNGTIASRAWDFGDGATSTSTNPVHTYAGAGTYNVTLVATDNQGATDDEVKSVTVTVPGSGKAYLSRNVFKRTITLSGAVSSSDDTIPLTELLYWPSEGEGMIDAEKISWTGKSVPGGSGYLTGVSRGIYSTAATSHLSGATVGLMGRHDGAISTKRLVPTLPINASVTLQELRTHEGERFAWVDLNNFRETAELVITGAPTASGNVSTTLDEGGTAVTRNAVVSGSAETISLTINNAQTTAGDIIVTLDGVAKTITLAGGLQQNQVVFSGTATSTAAGDIYYYPATNIQTYGANLVAENNGDSASTIAGRLRATSVPGWSLSGSGKTVLAIASTTGQRGESPYTGNFAGFYYDADASGITATNTTLVTGAGLLTAIGVADFIRATSFPGWATGGTPGTATVTFTSLNVGNLTGTHSYSAGTTGATSTSGMSATNGTSTTTSAVATAIRALYSGNTYWTVGGAGSTVTWVATSTGAKQDATFNPQATGTTGSMSTVYQGSTDIETWVKDASGEIQNHRVLANITTSTVFNIETAVSGAGTSRGIVSAWGSFGTDAKVLLRRFEELDLTNMAVGQLAFGVTEESTTGLIWDVHTDETEVTDRGLTYYRDHTIPGALIRQVRGYFRNEPTQPRQDWLVQGLRQPVIPGEQISVGAYLTYEGIPTSPPAKPLYVTLNHADGTITELGTLTASGLSATGQSGDGAWAHVYGTFTVPIEVNPERQAYEFRIASRDTTQGSIIFQELAISIGTTVKRTYLYAPNGTVRVTFDRRNPKEVFYARFGRRRTALETEFETPATTLASAQYRSANTVDELINTWYADELDVVDLDVTEVEVALTGDGLSTPELLPASPRNEYRLLVGQRSHQPMLLKGDRTELPGGAWFVKYEDWFYSKDTQVSLLGSGYSQKQPMHPPVGLMPKFQLGVTNPEAKNYIQEHWDEEYFVVEAYGQALTIDILVPPDFGRKVPSQLDSRGWRRGYWETADISANVISVADIPETT